MSHIYSVTTLEQQNLKTKCEKCDLLEIKFLCFTLRHEKLLRGFQFLFACINIIGFIYSVTGKLMLYNEFTDFKNEVVIFINCLTEFLLVAVNVFTIIGYTNNEFSLELLAFITQHSYLLLKECKIFVRVLKTFRWLALLPIGLEIYFVGKNVGWRIFQYFLLRNIWCYTVNLMICGFVCIIAKLRCFFAAMNHFLEDIDKKHSALRNNDSKEYISLKTEQRDHIPQTVNDITNQYTQLCDLLDRFNRYIRFFLVLVVLSITANILYNCTILIEFGTKSKTLIGTTSQRVVMVIQIIATAIAVGQIALCALIGEDLQDQGETTSAICYTILNKLRNTQNENDKLFIKELNFLVAQSGSRKVYVHAGGFFRLNWGILGSVTSTVATYSIVIIQFLMK